MTDDDRKPGGGWDLIEDLLAEEEIEQQRALPAEERRAAMKERGLDADAAHAAVSEALVKAGFGPIAATAPPAAPKVANLAEERAKRRRPAWMLALVAAAAVVVVGGGGGAIVALSGPGPSSTTPGPTVPTAPPGPSPEQLAQQENRAKAEELRKVAATDCRAEKWDDCQKSLGKASVLDPDGQDTRAVKRMYSEANRGRVEQLSEAKQMASPRSIGPKARAELVMRLSAWKGQALRVECARDPEAASICTQLVAAFTSAGWNVTRAAMPSAAPDAAVLLGMLLEVATDADEKAQGAADDLVGGLESAYLYARGPDDAPPGGEAPLRLIIGKQ